MTKLAGEILVMSMRAFGGCVLGVGFALSVWAERIGVKS